MKPDEFLKIKFQVLPRLQVFAASGLYNLEVLASSIQTIKNNVTRFVIVQKKGDEVPQEHINKAALKFTLDHQRGSLAAVFKCHERLSTESYKNSILACYRGLQGNMLFFVDVTFDELEFYDKARKLITIMASHFKILGEYAQHIR